MKQRRYSTPMLLLLLLFPVAAIYLPIAACFFPKPVRDVDLPLVLFGTNNVTGTVQGLAGGATMAAAAEEAHIRDVPPRPNMGPVLREEGTTASAGRAHGNDAADDDAAKEDLIFEGEFEYRSDLLPASTTASPSDLLQFFLDRNHRDLLLKGGGHPIERIPATPALYEEWTSQAREVDSAPPDGQHDEEVLDVYSVVHLVPGLSIEAVSCTGCKVTTDPRNALPVYEFTLLQESYQARGTRPMVWAFDRVTGNGSNIRQKGTAIPTPRPTTTGISDTGSRKTYALSRVTVKPFPKEGGCRVCYYGRVKVACKLPKAFLNFLPLSKQKVQERISKSIVNQLKKEGVQSIDKFCDALGNWANNSNDGGRHHLP